MEPIITQASEPPAPHSLGDGLLFNGDLEPLLMVLAPLVAVVLVRSHMRRAREQLAPRPEPSPTAASPSESTESADA